MVSQPERPRENVFVRISWIYKGLGQGLQAGLQAKSHIPGLQ
jgi:hypothetical protein